MAEETTTTRRRRTSRKEAEKPEVAEKKTEDVAPSLNDANGLKRDQMIAAGLIV